MQNFTNRVRANLKKTGFLVCLFLVISSTSFPQSLGINSASSPPNAEAGLDVDFSTLGLLIPRLALSGTASPAPLLSHVAGMLVYNTATAGDVAPGFYQDNGTKWNVTNIAGAAPGDMSYWNGTAWVVIPAGSTGQFLQINGSGIPSWITVSLATITTATASSITPTSAVSGGTITADGGSPVMLFGVCWDISTNPTVALATKTIGVSGNLGSFSSNITGLTTGTTYYVRAYATNMSGTAYGNEVSFTTP